MKHWVWIIILVFLILLIVILIQTTGWNTVFAKGFNVEIWEAKVGNGMTQAQVKDLLGEPLLVDSERRCDFYSKPRFNFGEAHLKFKEYKVCYDANQMFFLKLKFEYGYLFNENY